MTNSYFQGLLLPFLPLFEHILLIMTQFQLSQLLDISLKIVSTENIRIVITKYEYVHTTIPSRGQAIA